MTIKDYMERLEKFSTSLNTDSDELVLTIHDIEERLQKLNLGVEAWIDLPKDDTDLVLGVGPSAKLGYAKRTIASKGWAIQISYENGYQYPLLEANRNSRLIIVSKYLPTLFEQLLVETTTLLAKVQHAIIVAKSITDAMTKS